MNAEEQTQRTNAQSAIHTARLQLSYIEGLIQMLQEQSAQTSCMHNTPLANIVKKLDAANLSLETANAILEAM